MGVPVTIHIFVLAETLILHSCFDSVCANLLKKPILVSDSLSIIFQAPRKPNLWRFFKMMGAPQKNNTLSIIAHCAKNIYKNIFKDVSLADGFLD